MTGNITQADKLAALHNSELLRKDTYHARAQVDADEVGGRFAAVNKSTVIGSTGTPVYPQQPEGSPWRADPVGREPPLGYAVDAMEPIEAARIPEQQDADASSAAPPTSTLLRRRL